MGLGKTCSKCDRPARSLGLCRICYNKQYNANRQAFVIGPMCGVNRITSEPPQHLECAEYAAKACPFLTRPMATRNNRDLPEDATAAGIMIARNPGVTLIWSTKKITPFKVSNGYLFKLGDPTCLSFWCKGRAATRAEALESVNTGLPTLRSYAERDGPEGVAQLEVMIAAFMPLLPPEDPK